MTSKSLVAFFVTAQVLFGFDTGFFSVLSKRHRALANCTSFLSTVFILCPAIFLTNFTVINGLFVTVSYCLSVISFRFVCSKYTLKKFYDDLSVIDKRWKTGISDHNFGIIIGLFAFTTIFSRFMVSLTYAVVFGSPSVLLPIAAIFASDVLTIINAVIFHSVYKRLNALKISLDSFEHDVISAQAFFNDIADCFEKVRERHDNLIFLAFISDTAKFMIIIYGHLHYVLEKRDWTIKVLGGVYPMYHCIHICLSSLFAEMIAVQVEGIKMMLHDRLLFEQDVDEKQRLQRFLGHLEGRELLRKAWRLVPVDLRQPVAILNFGVTYLIVIVQFTHLYE